MPARHATTIYADRLSPSLASRLLARRCAGVYPDGCEVRLIEGTGQPAGLLVRALLALCGARVTPSGARLAQIDQEHGRDILTEASQMASEASLQAARDLVGGSSLLRTLDGAFRQGSVTLILAKYFLAALRPFYLHALTADHLAGQASQASQTEAILHLDSHIPVHLPLRALGALVPVRPPRLGPALLLGALRRMGAETLRGLRRRSRPASQVPGLRPGVPTVVAMPDGNISLDRSIRSCPHWLFLQDKPDRRFQTIVLHGDSNHIVGGADDLTRQGLLTMHEDTLRFFPPAAPELEDKFRSAKASLLGALLSGHPVPGALLHLFDHLRAGLLFARMAEVCGVRAVVTPKCYETLPDAVDMVADDAGLTTFHYQYSFLNVRTLLSSRRSDTLFLFSDFFRAYFDFGMSAQVVPNGYVFGSSLPLVRERCQALRGRMRQAGARFLLCYFPENYIEAFSSPMTRSEFLDTFRTIAEFVAARPDMGLIVKAKNPRRSPAKMVPVPAVDRLLAEGRYVEVGGTMRYSEAFPFEAAGAADLVLGDAYGCTAVFEAALGGARGILHGTAGSASPTQQALERHGLVYPTLGAALDAVQAVYESRPGSEAIGDWSQALGLFDSHGDLEAGHRMRRAILASLGLQEQMADAHAPPVDKEQVA